MDFTNGQDRKRAVIELEAVLSSTSFQSAPGLRSFLRYVVERTLEGHAEDLKEYAIGVEALGRGQSFEPRTDSIVRVQARRVRERLAAYYAAEGRDSPLRIELPVGGYAPEFRTAPGVVDNGRSAKVARSWFSGGRAIGLVSGVAAAAILLLSASHRNEQPLDLVAEPLTYYEGKESEASFSPGGNQIVFTWNSGDKDAPELYVKTVGGSEPLPLTDDPGREFSPAWSPDGEWVAFLRRDAQGRIAAFRVPALGGREEELLELSLADGTGIAGTVRRRYLGWSPDSKFLVLSDQEQTDVAASLYLFSLDDGTKQRLTQATSDGLGDQNPALSANGRTLVFSGSRGEDSGIFSLGMGDGFMPVGEPEYIPFPRDQVFGPAWINLAWANEREVLVNAGFRLWRATFPSKTMSPAELPGVQGSFPTISERGRRLAYTNTVYDANIWRIDLDHDRTWIGSAPTRVIASSGYNVNFHLAPDGKQIVFQSTRDNRHSLWIADADGSSTPAPLTSVKGGTPRWSPGGDAIVFDAPSDADNRAVFDIWMIRPQRGPAKAITTSPSDHRLPSWSRDGEWIYFSSNRGDGYQVWKRHIKTGEERRITRDGGRAAIEAADGFVYYVKGVSDYSVWRVPAEGGEEVQVLDALLSFNPFTVADAGMYYIPGRRSGGPNKIMFYSFEDGSKHLVYTSEKTLSSGVAVSRDERTLFFSQVDRDESDLMLVEGFR